MPRIVLMGHRPGAVTAARRLGLDARVVVFADMGEPPASSLPVEVLEGEGSADLESLAERIGDADAIVALTERMVVPAARLRGLLDVPGVPSAVALRGHDKLVMKEALVRADVPCAPFRAVSAAHDVDALVAELGLPLFLKDRRGSGTRGTVLAMDHGEVRAALRDDGLAERPLRGEEMSLEAFVVDGVPVFVNATQYLVPFWANVLPAPLAPDLRESLAGLLHRTIAAIGFRSGMVHLEVFVSKGSATVGEIALRPPGGGLMRLLEIAYGFDAWSTLLRLELGEPPALPAEARCFAGVWLFHPGSGVVEAVEGLEDVRAMASVRRLHCAAEPGSTLDERVGSGQSVGSVICAGPSHDALVRDLVRAKERVRFRVDGELRAADAARFAMADAKRRIGSS